VAGIAPADLKLPPKETLQIPTAGPSPLPALIEFVQGEQREIDGKNVLTGAVLVSGDGYASILAYGTSTRISTVALDDAIGSAVFEAGQMTHFEPQQPLIPITGNFLVLTDAVLTQAAPLPTSTSYTLSSGSRHADFGTDGILAWGRWIDGVSILGLTESFNANQGLHYVVGIPTASMPQTGSATYSLLGATRPTYLDGSDAPGTFTGSLNVTFGAQASVGMVFNVAMPGRNYTMSGTAVANGSTFTASSLDKVLSVTGSCVSCGGLVEGFFAGTNAERAGVGYHINDSAQLTGTDILGSAAFTK